MSSRDTARQGEAGTERHSDVQPPAGQSNAERATQQRTAADDVSEWFARSALRTGLALVGLLVLLFALGQAVGFPLLDLFIDAVTSQTGRWLIVALFALVLIALAVRGFSNRQGAA